MASRKKTRRIEPTFESSVRDDASAGFFVGEDDRVLPAVRKKKSAATQRSNSTRRKPSRSRTRPRRGGLLAWVRGAAYWGMVLCLWGGIAGIGIVIYYGAQMPAATTWAIPDRPPNVRIVSVNGQLVANRGMTGGEA